MVVWYNYGYKIILLKGSVMAKNGNNHSKTAQELGVSRQMLYKILKAYGEEASGV